LITRATSISALFRFARLSLAFVLHSSVVKNISLALAAALSACASESTDQSSMSAGCPPSLPFAYVDRAHGFRICLPAGLRKEAPEDYPERSVQFTGFALPRKTNLESKWLLIVSGDYDLLKAAAPFGHFKANSIVFERAKFDEGSAGHLTLHIIYSWKHGKSAVHFDFEHRLVNIYNFDPPQRPAEYDRAAQIKITEQIMSTFRKL
jgi:hypothetical protein